MNNQELIQKMKKDMELRNFSHYTYDSYLGKTKDLIKYFGEKNLEEVTVDELRTFLLEHLKDKRKLEDSSINYYNSVIRFVYEVTLDKVLNKRQLPMRKKKKKMYKVLTKEELSTFFNAVDDFKFKTIFMLIYGSGLRIGEIEKLQVQDIDSKNMRIFVREGKGNKERYTVLPEKSLEMLREYWTKYRPKGIDSDAMFFDATNKPINVYVIRTHFREYRRKAGISEEYRVHGLRHNFATNLIENGADILEVKELLGHSNIRSTMVYVHIANKDVKVKSPLDVLMEGEENGENSGNIK
ncbi:MAG: site-specific integrase [Clostridia bacterium]|nr:site-specific integrase [Clostridia bacterium]